MCESDTMVDDMATIILASFDVYLYLSSFVAQMGRMLISWHIYPTSKVSCEYRLTSINTFYITHHDNAHNDRLHCGGITSLSARKLVRKM